MFKCLDCGEVFSEDELLSWSEYRGECHGSPAYEKMCGCPSCKGDYEVAKACEICGEYFTESEMPDGVCEDCIEAHKTVDFCIEIGAEESESVEINSFFTSVYTEEDIDFILEEYYRQHTDKQQMAVDCDEFYKSDCGWFAEKIIEKEGNKK